MKQTAVKFIIDEISCRFIISEELRIAMYKAIEMEKEQHDNTAEEWWEEGAHYVESGGKCKWKSFEQYYKETFKSE
jgi:hypothetical protein